MKVMQKQEDGTEIEVEVFTAADVDAKLQEKDTEWAGKLAEKETAMNTLATEKSELEKKLGETKEDNPNFKILKDALAKKDEDIKKITDTIENDKKTQREEAMNLKVQAVAKGNAEVEKKIKLHLTSTLSGMPEDNAENRQKKLDAAVKLSIDAETGPGMFDGGIGGGGGNGSGGTGGGNKAEFTANEKSLGKKLGISEEDYKKYGSRVSKRN